MRTRWAPPSSRAWRTGPPALLSSANGYGYRGQNGNDVLVNAGTIEGHGGAGNTDAIYMGALGVGTLILQTGSVIRGGADGGAARAMPFSKAAARWTTPFATSRT
jgi:hypothetical protein